MGRLHFSSAPKYQKVEPVCDEQTFPTWADQAFDPEAEDLGGLAMVYEAFVREDGRPLLPDDADAISELNSESSSSAATEDDDYPERLRSPTSPALSPQVVDPGSSEFDDFVRIEVPRPEPDGRPSTAPRPSSPLVQSITSTNVDDLPEHPSSDTPEVVLQRGDDERLFSYYRSHSGGSYERERPHYAARVVPGLDSRMASPARRVPGHARFSRPEGQRAPLSNPSIPDHGHPRPRSASVSDTLVVGARVPERWHTAVDGTVISSRVLAQR